MTDAKATRMEIERTISVDDLARRLPDVLDRVRYRNERFVVEVQGKPVATLSPVGSQLDMTLYGALDSLGDLDLPGDGFADDVEAVQAAQLPARFPEWPT